MQQEVVGNLHGDHGGEHGADQVQKAGDIVHGEQDGPGHAHHSGDDGHRLAADPAGQGLGGDAGGPGVQERGGDGGEHQDHQGGNAQTGLDHDDGDVILAGEDGRAHADDVHPAGYQTVGDHAGCRGPDGLLGLAGIVADQGQPGQRHGHRQLHRRAEGQALTGGGGHGAAGEEDHLAQHQGQHEQGGHGDLVDPAQVGDAHHDPQQDQCADDQAPDPAANVEDAADGQGTVIDHDGGPAHQLQHVQQSEQQAALLAEAHFHGLHGAAAGAAADETRQQHHAAADDMADEDGQQALAHAQRGEGRAGKDLRQGDACPEPDQGVLKGGGLFHSANPPFRSNMWFMGPEPLPRSSMAASAPEIYALARSTDWSRS